MNGAFALDHVVLLVGDLAAVSYELGLCGFTVLYGGEHEAFGSHNSLIAFEDGSYLEVFAFRPGSPHTAGGRIARWKERGEGLVDVALLPSTIDDAIRGAADRGLRLEGPIPGGRERPDGQEIAWNLAFPDSFDLPFLCADVTPRAMRVSGGAALRHPNGARGIRRLRIGVRSVGASLGRWRALLGDASSSNDPELRVGASTVRLKPAGGPEGPLEVEIEAKGGTTPAQGGAIDRLKRFGVRLSGGVRRAGKSSSGTSRGRSTRG